MSILSKGFPYVEAEKSCFDDYKISHVIIDFDGTLSLLRTGWQNVMQDYFEEQAALSAYENNVSRQTVRKKIADLIEINTGRQTIYQCIAFAEILKSMGCLSLDPEEYKKEYNKRLLTKINHRICDLENDKRKADLYLVPGSMKLLEMLQSHKVELYLASGTDQEDVEHEADLLGISAFFGSNIYGARSDYKVFSKEILIRRIMKNHKLSGYHLLGIGDGFVEIENVKAVGGLACAVCSDEYKKGWLNIWKYNRLKLAGADMFISDYRRIDLLKGIWFA